MKDTKKMHMLIQSMTNTEGAKKDKEKKGQMCIGKCMWVSLKACLGKALYSCFLL